MGWLEIKLLLLDWRIQVLIGVILLALLITGVLTYVELSVKKKREVISYKEKKKLFFSKFRQQVMSAKGVREKMDVIDRVAKAYFRDVFEMNTKKDYLSLIADFKSRGQKELANFCKIMFEYYYSPKDVSEGDVDNIMNFLLNIIASIDEYSVRAQNKEFYEKTKQIISEDSSENSEDKIEPSSDESIIDHQEKYLPNSSNISEFKPSETKLDPKAKSLLDEVEVKIEKEEPEVLSNPSQGGDEEDEDDELEYSNKNDGQGIIGKLKAIRSSFVSRRIKNKKLKIILKKEKELGRKLLLEEKKRRRIEALELERARRKEIERTEQQRLKEKNDLNISIARKKIMDAEKAYRFSKPASILNINPAPIKEAINRSKDLVVSLKNLRDYSLTIQRERELDKKEMEKWKGYNLEQLVSLRESLKKDIKNISEFIENSKNSRVYSCANCDIEVSEREATEKNFTCSNCGQFYVPIESKIFLIDSKRKLIRLKKALNYVESRISFFGGESKKRRILGRQMEVQEKDFERQSEELDLERQEWLKSLESKRSGMREDNR